MNIKVQDGNMIFINLFEVILINILILALPLKELNMLSCI